MSNQTTIHWADSTCNPTMGCDGCELWNNNCKSCYAGQDHEKFGAVRRGYSPRFDCITYWAGRMAKAAAQVDLFGRRRHDKPWLDGMLRLIFISDMGDALCDSVPFEFLRLEIIENVMSPQGRRHCWLWVTKRPNRMAEFSVWLLEQGIPWPANLWAGTTVTTAATTPRIDELLKVGNAKTIRFLSVEPQLESLDLCPWLPQIDWVIQAGESGQAARPFDVAWAQEMFALCQELGTPYFLKQLGANACRGDEPLRLRNGHGSDWNEWPEGTPKVRQMPAPNGEALAAARTCDGHFCDANRKLGDGMLSYDLSPILACPGSRLALCRELRPDGNVEPKSICWACRGCYREHAKKVRLLKNYCFTYSEEFVRWVNKVLSGRGHNAHAVRIPGTGDFYSPEFVAKVREIVRANPETKFWAYTRSWTDPTIWAAMQKLGDEPNMVLWMSWDRKLAEYFGAPPNRKFPWAWFAETDEDLPPAPVDLVFRYKDQSHRAVPYLPILGGAVVCLHEDGRTDTSCAKCGLCWAGAQFRQAKIAKVLDKYK
jgi:protein gp37